MPGKNTPWVEDDLAPTILFLELSLICSDKMKASAAEFFNKPADFVPTEVREDVQCRQPCSRTLFDLEALLKVLPRLWDASSLVVDPFEAVFEAPPLPSHWSQRRWRRSGVGPGWVLGWVLACRLRESDSS